MSSDLSLSVDASSSDSLTLSTRMTRPLSARGRRSWEQNGKDVPHHAAEETHPTSQGSGAGSGGLPLSIRVHVRVHYVTQPGERVFVCGSVPALGGWEPREAAVLRWTQGHYWVGEVEIPTPVTSCLEAMSDASGDVRLCEYKYVVRGANSEDMFRIEGGRRRLIQVNVHELYIAGKEGHFFDICCEDRWRSVLDVDTRIAASSAFAEVLFGIPEHPNPILPVYGRSLSTDGASKFVHVRIEVDAWRVRRGDFIAITGSAPILGNWNLSHAIRLESSLQMYPSWAVEFFADIDDFPIRYKFLIATQNSANNWEELMWEEGDDRILSVESIAHSSSSSSSSTVSRVPINYRHMSISGGEFRYPFGLSSLNLRAAGSAIPIFSLRTDKSVGCGEFLDLKLYADWSAHCGLHLIQVLPVNDTRVTNSWKDSYPYSSLSVFALHPMYINLQALIQFYLPRCPSLKVDLQNLLERVEKQRVILDGYFVDYEATLEFKLEILSKLFDYVWMDFCDFLSSSTFLESNMNWLPFYAVFCVFKDEHGGQSNFHMWNELSQPSEEDILSLFDDFMETVESACRGSQASMSAAMAAAREKRDPLLSRSLQTLFYVFIQYHLDSQLIEASDYCRDVGVSLKGDLPIGVDPCSVDCWIWPQFFRLDTQTGAPPDFFSTRGQNWGFPTYNWEEMANTDYRWWKARLNQLDKYFHAIRIDHVLGLFRIWQLPDSAVTGMSGHFHPSFPITRSELDRSGIWDLRHLCTPSIRFGVLCSLVDPTEAHRLRMEYFESVSTDHIHDDTELYLLPEWQSEKRFQNESRESSEILNILFDHVFANVCLFRSSNDPEGSFYPRFALWKTDKYTRLGHSIQRALYDLCISYFYDRQEDLWGRVGFERCSMIRETSKMLVCAEDLGLVPNCVAPVLSDLGILGLRVQRMPADDKKEFDLPWTYPFRTVATTSSHDMAPIRLWWEEDRSRAAKYFSEVLGFGGHAPYFCEHWVVERILRQHLESPSMWTILPFQDWVALSPDLRHPTPADEQINDPSNRFHEWKYRMHIPIEKLLSHENFLSQLRSLIQSANRNNFYS